MMQSAGVHPQEDQDPDLSAVRAPLSLYAQQLPFECLPLDLLFIKLNVLNKAKLTC